MYIINSVLYVLNINIVSRLSGILINRQLLLITPRQIMFNGEDAG